MAFITFDQLCQSLRYSYDRSQRFSLQASMARPVLLQYNPHPQVKFDTDAKKRIGTRRALFNR